MRMCSVDGCNKKHEARGYCREHYKRFMLHGDPLTIKQESPGSGWIDKKGYKYFTINGKSTREHRIVMESILGHKLPKGSCVHHIDENRLNNDSSNLMYFPSYGEHRRFHARLEAFKTTGHYDWQKCPYCHQYDDPANMVKESVRYVHSTCRNLLQKRMREEKINAVHI
jgi:hypothetical protein